MIVLDARCRALRRRPTSQLRPETGRGGQARRRSDPIIAEQVAGLPYARFGRKRDYGPVLDPVLSPPLSTSTMALPGEIALQYDRARPFPHLAIANFFDSDFCDRLAAEFPRTERTNLFVEYGRTIGKATVESLRDIGPAFAVLDDVLAHESLLRWLEEVTGIPGLLADPSYLGGGTHENLPGQVLHPHVDFSRHPVTGWYRRLNLLVYMNSEWYDDWGGRLTLHEDPRLGAAGESVTYAPTRNFAVLFGTSDRSWHSFDRLRLEEAPAGTSRRSISAYYYTEEPPPVTASDHSTVYVPPPVLSGRDDFERSALAEEWDALLRHEQIEQRRLSESVAALQQQLDEAKAHQLLPIRGYLDQVGVPEGYYPGRWTAPRLIVRLRPLRRLSALSVDAYTPDGSPRVVRFFVDQELVGSTAICAEGPVKVTAPLVRAASEEFTFELEVFPALRASGDNRELGVVLLAIEGEHDQ